MFATLSDIRTHVCLLGEKAGVELTQELSDLVKPVECLILERCCLEEIVLIVHVGSESAIEVLVCEAQIVLHKSYPESIP